MQYCKLKKSGDGYFYREASSIEMDTLVFFLTDDVGGHINSWIKFALDETRMGTASNASGLDKEGDFIILGDLLHEDDEVRVDTLTIHKNDFINMLVRWEELYKQQPDEIIITYDEQGKISMVGKFNDGREI